MTTKAQTKKTNAGNAETQESILIIDGSNLAFRMFFALEMTNMRNSEGFPTWAIYGTCKAMFDMLEKEKPSSMTVAFDTPVATFRHETFDGYKANRPDEMPEELKQQWGHIKDVFRYFHIPVLEEPGLEADDLIAIMAKKAEEAGQKVMILSGDRDLFQLVTENISVITPVRGGSYKTYGPAEVYEQLGVWPNQVTDYKGIAGDSSDNIPGVKGLGPKSTVNLLSKYENLENIYENIEEVGPPKTKEKLVDQEEQARLSKFLATLILDEKAVKEADLELKHCELSLPDLNHLVAFLKGFEFNSILRRLPAILMPFNNGELVKVDVGDLPEQSYKPQNTKKETTKSKKDSEDKDSGSEDISEQIWDQMDTPLEPVKVNPIIITDETSLNSFIKQLSKQEIYAFDLETNGLNTLNCEIVSWAFAFSGKNSPSDKDIKTFYIPILHQNIVQLPGDLVLEKLKPILEDNSKLQIMQNAKFEKKILVRHGVESHENFFDTMLASYVENPQNKHGLKAQSKRVFKLQMTEIEEIIGTGRKQITIDQAAIDQVAPYAAADAFITYKLYHHYLNVLPKESMKILQEIEHPLVNVLAEMELEGVSLNLEHFEKLSKELSQKVTSLQSEIWEIAGQEFNVASPKQLSGILFDELEIEPIGKKNKSGNYSTDMGTLEELLASDIKKAHKKLIKALIEYRTLSKLLSTYVDSLPKLVDKKTQRLHSDFNQVVTATGRLSSSNPNLQNIPIRTDYGKQIREGFIAKDSDYILISADYSQIELRLLADMANEKALIDAFKHDQDIHAHTASQILGKDEDEIDSEERNIGKTLNFSLIYMQGPFSTAKQLGITPKEAKAFTTKYFEAFPKVKPFMDKVLAQAHEVGYTETMFGRRRYYRNINSRNKIIQKEEERQAFNAPLQGTAADIIKKAMISLVKSLKERKSKAKVILQVHDELVLEVPKAELEDIKELVLKEMQFAHLKKPLLKVPLLVDLATGDNWLEAK